jgi:hypothetical protein
MMSKISAVLALVPLASMSAVASDEVDVMAVVHQWRASFNSGDFKTGNSPCADEAVVIDDFAPHVWQGPAACSRWYKDFEAFTAKASITRANIVVQRPLTSSSSQAMPTSLRQARCPSAEVVSRSPRPV